MSDAPHILVVDDEPVVTRAGRRILEAEGFTVDEAADAEAAERLLLRTAYRAVLCDLMLPGTDCLRMMRRIAARLADTPVIVMTGFATISNAVRAFGSGAFDFLPKPFDAAELTGVVRRALLFGSAGPLAARGGFDGRYAADPGPAERLFLLGHHSWALLQSEGSAAIGLGPTFAILDERKVQAELPSAGDEILQGNRCVRITSGPHVYRVWAPLSGRVVEVDPRGLDDVGPVGWPAACARRLLRIVPSDPEDELANLSAAPREAESRPREANDGEGR